MNTRFKNKILSITLTIVLTFSMVISASAHSGRTDSNGGHYVRTAGKGYPVGSYHYHNGGSAYTPKTYTPTVNNYVNNTKKIQLRLNALGYKCGVADGVMGVKTRNAIKNFQNDNDLVADGIVGVKTNNSLFN